MVWFFIGLEGQTALSVRGTVDYAGRLLERFPGGRVLPVVCPMAPFLDPGSRIFESPARHGYRLFHRSLADHRRALVEPVWYRRLNYETRWMSRAEIQASAYEAAARLATFKAEVGALPRSFARAVLGRIDVTTSLLGRVDEALEGGGPLPPSLRAEIRAYNAEMLSFCSDQVVPSRRPLQGRWFDDYATPPELVRACRPEGA
jgi:clorobiocin biosynthesis protein CloN6